MSSRIVMVLALLGAVGLPVLAPSGAARAQMPSSINPGFVGRWCVGGDPTKVGTIAQSAFGVQLTNESGSTSTAVPAGADGSTITALQWDLVQGTLSGDGNRITWTNGTFWNHCSRPRATLDGTWYAGGNPANLCTIAQQYGALSFVNESGVTASGNFDGPHHLTAIWQGQPIGGTISPDGSRIDWSNGTYWTR